MMVKCARCKRIMYHLKVDHLTKYGKPVFICEKCKKRDKKIEVV